MKTQQGAVFKTRISPPLLLNINMALFVATIRRGKPYKGMDLENRATKTTIMEKFSFDARCNAIEKDGVIDDFIVEWENSEGAWWVVETFITQPLGKWEWQFSKDALCIVHSLKCPPEGENKDDAAIPFHKMDQVILFSGDCSAAGNVHFYSGVCS